MLLVTLADPILRLTVINKQKPFLYLVFDGTDSMAIEDELPDADRKAIEAAVDFKPVASRATEAREVSTANPQPASGPSRTDYLAALLRKPSDNLITRLTRDKFVQIEAYLFDGDSTSRLRKLELNRLASLTGGSSVDPAHLAEQLSTKGRVTALGSVVHEVGEQFGSGRLAGVVMFSDFAHNSGIAPLSAGNESPAAPGPSSAPRATVRSRTGRPRSRLRETRRAGRRRRRQSPSGR